MYELSESIPPLGPAERQMILNAIDEEISITEANPEYVDFLVEAVWLKLFEMEGEHK